MGATLIKSSGFFARLDTRGRNPRSDSWFPSISQLMHCKAQPFHLPVTFAPLILGPPGVGPPSTKLWIPPDQNQPMTQMLPSALEFLPTERTCVLQVQVAEKFPFVGDEAVSRSGEPHCRTHIGIAKRVWCSDDKRIQGPTTP